MRGWQTTTKVPELQIHYIIITILVPSKMVKCQGWLRNVGEIEFFHLGRFYIRRNNTYLEDKAFER